MYKKLTVSILGGIIVLYSQQVFSQNIETAHTIYEIQAEFNPNDQMITATARIVIPEERMMSNNKIYIKTRSAGMGRDGKPLLRINRIHYLEGEDLKYQQVEEDNLISVKLPDKMESEQDTKTAIVVDYTIPLDQQPEWKMSDFGYLFFWSNATGDYNNGDLWYPDVVESTELPIQIRDFEVSLTYPSEYTVLTSGVPVGQERLPEGKLKTKFSAEDIAGFSINIAEGFNTYTVEENGYKVTSFYPPELEKAYREAAKLTLDAMGWYEQEYGFFPVKQIGIAAGGRTWGGGYASSNLFWIHRLWLDTEFIRWITSHELGHYYWGYHVLSDSDQKLNWLLLANGIWVDQLYIAQANNRSFEEQWRTMGSGDSFVDYMQIQLNNREQRLGLSSSEQSNLGFNYNSLVRHGKAATGLYLLSQRVGTARFLEMQKKIIDEKRYNYLTVEDFIEYVQASGFDDAEAFIRSWMRSDASIGYAVYNIEPLTGSNNEYEITIQRTGSIAYPVTVEVVDSEGKKVRKEITGTERTEKITFVLANPLTRINLDPDGILPIENSSHPEIQRLYLEALYRARHDMIFIKLAEKYLSAHPDDVELKTKIEARRKLYTYDKLNEQ